MRVLIAAALVVSACGTDFKSAQGDPSSGGVHGTSDVCPCPEEGGVSSGGGGSDGGSVVSSGGGGGDGGQGGTVSSDGSAPVDGVAPEILERYIYWTSATEALIQVIDGGTGQVTASTYLPGPDASAASSWSMRTLVPLRDGTSKALWARGIGFAEIWTLNAAFEKISGTPHAYEGPEMYLGSAYRRLPDGTGRLAWYNTSTHETQVWTLDALDVRHGTALEYLAHAPDAFLPVHYTTLPDGAGLLLWAGLAAAGPLGLAEVWRLPTDAVPPAAGYIEHDVGFWPRSLTQDPDGSARFGVGTTENGSGQVCELPVMPTDTVVKPTVEGWGPGMCKTYTQAGMVFRGYVARWQD